MNCRTCHTAVASVEHDASRSIVGNHPLALVKYICGHTEFVRHDALPTVEYGIEHSVPGLARKVYACNFRSRGEADSYAAERVSTDLRPVIMQRVSVPQRNAIDVVGLTDWEVAP